MEEEEKGGKNELGGDGEEGEQNELGVDVFRKKGTAETGLRSITACLSLLNGIL